MYNRIREEIKKSVEKAIVEGIQTDEIQESQIGDFSFRTFKLAGKFRKDPKELAKEISGKIKAAKFVEKIEAADAYVNFFLDYSAILSEFLKSVSKDENYGKGKPKNRKIILEHTSVNPSGPIHVGRVRNSLIGDSLARILKFSGYDIETHYYVNDIGKQIAIISQGFDENLLADEEIIEKYKDYKEKDDFQIFFEYVSANRKFQEDEQFQERVQKLIQKAESGNKKSLNAIKNVAKKCLSGQKKTFARLNINFDSFDFESKYIENGDVEKILSKLRKNNERTTKNELGFGLNLEKFGLQRREAITVLARSDGTSVYLTRDLCYHLEKATLGDEMINILGEDHKFEFLELKCILENFLGLKKPLNVVHFSFVNFEGEELSTRKGLIVPVDKLIDDAIEKAENEVEKRKIASREIAPMIGIGAVKYHILKTSPQKQITFKWDEALNFDGETAPYIQYAHARCCSILKNFKGKIGKIKFKTTENLTEEEKELLKKLMKFSYVVENSAKELKPNIIANYLYELASDFSRFYKKCQVLGVEKGISERRILLVNATRIVIKNGLGLLGIDTPEQM